LGEPSQAIPSQAKRTRAEPNRDEPDEWVNGTQNVTSKTNTNKIVAISDDAVPTSRNYHFEFLRSVRRNRTPLISRARLQQRDKSVARAARNTVWQERRSPLPPLPPRSFSLVDAEREPHRVLTATCTPARIRDVVFVVPAARQLAPPPPPSWQLEDHRLLLGSRTINPAARRTITREYVYYVTTFACCFVFLLPRAPKRGLASCFFFSPAASVAPVFAVFERVPLHPCRVSGWGVVVFPVAIRSSGTSCRLLLAYLARSRLSRQFITTAY